MGTLQALIAARRLLLAALACGLVALLLSRWLHVAALDPLLLSLLFGIVLQGLLGERRLVATAAEGAAGTRLLLSVGVLFYALVHLDPVALARVSPPALLLVAGSLAASLLAIFWLGARLKQRRQVTGLVATGSAVCGASAIAITAPSVGGEPEDVSIALLAIVLVGLAELFIVLPFCSVLLGLSREQYGLMAGALLPLTGFIATGVEQVRFLPGTLAPEQLLHYALLIKATRFFALLVTIPLCASLVRRRLVFPPALWLFVAGGVIGVWVRSTGGMAGWSAWQSTSETCYLVLWTSAMAAIGLSTDIRCFLSDQGYRAFGMALFGFGAALAFFLGGVLLFGRCGVNLL